MRPPLNSHRTGQRNTRPNQNVIELRQILADARADGLDDHDTAIRVLARLWERDR